MVWFINLVAVRFGYETAYETSSCPTSDLLVKLIGLSFTSTMRQDDMDCLGLVCYHFMKQLTQGLSPY